MSADAAAPPSPTESASSSVSDYKRNSDGTEKNSVPDAVGTAAAADEAQRPPEDDWKPSRHQKAIIYTLAITSLIVALDATIVITPLSV